MTVADLGIDRLRTLLNRFELGVERVADDQSIPGSFWGDAEAGLRGHTLYVRADTPVHSALHEAGHFVCMDDARRRGLDTNAGGDYDEENAVCYWQILAADLLAGHDRARMCAEMDAWGYTFRLGSAAAWFAEDAEDARTWLAEAGLIEPAGTRLRYALRR
ncbi:hypothetical protein [Salinisphaera sp. T31B1]|uniref:hypothetical protein n=1 Tax=Salinisphaera sp. T31B1 TaxID=727963 RepID=UPI00334106F9